MESIKSIESIESIESMLSLNGLYRAQGLKPFSLVYIMMRVPRNLQTLYYIIANNCSGYAEI